MLRGVRLEEFPLGHQQKRSLVTTSNLEDYVFKILERSVFQLRLGWSLGFPSFLVVGFAIAQTQLLEVVVIRNG